MAFLGGSKGFIVVFREGSIGFLEGISGFWVRFFSLADCRFVCAFRIVAWNAGLRLSRCRVFLGSRCWGLRLECLFRGFRSLAG